MKNLTHFFLFFLLMFNIIDSTAQKSVNSIIFGVYNRMQKVNDYSAEAKIVSDLPLIKILPVKATIYFKQKDKFRVVSKGIAILPKQGFNDLQKIISDTNSFTAVANGKETINSISTQVINVIPSNDTGDVVLAKLWIDPISYLVYKSQITSRENGTLVIDYFYTNYKNFGLPDNLIFTVDVKKFKIPKGIATDINKSNPSEEKVKKDAKYGKIFITLTNYKINAGVKDEVFKK
jgi:outer membrane lipoprotein-sorting protein